MEMIVTLRTATLDDVDEISPLIFRSIRAANAVDYLPDIIERICSSFTSEKLIEKMLDRDVFVAMRSEVIVGTVSLDEDKLHSLFVDPDLFRRGIGQTLVCAP